MKNVFIIGILFIFTSLTYSQKVYDFEFKDINNSTKTYEELKGKKLTLIDFWATWCKPCKKAIPELNNIYEKYKSDGLQIIGISCDGPRSVSKVAPLSKSLQIKYTVLLDINSELRTDLNVSAFPTLIFVNESGEIIKTHEGFVSGDEKEIEKEIKGLLNIK